MNPAGVYAEFLLEWFGDDPKPNFPGPVTFWVDGKELICLESVRPMGLYEAAQIHRRGFPLPAAENPKKTRVFRVWHAGVELSGDTVEIRI